MSVPLSELTIDELERKFASAGETQRQAIGQLLQLRRQQQLHQAALAQPGLFPEQRRVHRRCLDEARRREVWPERAIAAMDAGWMPFTPSREWSHGFVRDPRFLRGHANTLAIGLSLVLGSLAGWQLIARMASELPAGILSAVIIVAGLWAASRQILGAWTEARNRSLLSRMPASSRPEAPEADLLIFDAPMPAETVKAYRRAHESGLFDLFLVCSPRVEDFRRVSDASAPSLGLLDPILVGVIGGDTFEIARWDLATDLALA